MTKFKHYLSAGYPALWVTTHEEQRAIDTLCAQADGYDCYSWDIMRGMVDHQVNRSDELPDPVAALNAIATSVPDQSVVFLKDFHKFIKGVESFRTFKNLLPSLKSSDKHIVFVGPVKEIPVEIEKNITLYDFPLPSVDELYQVAEKIISENQLDIEIPAAAIESAKGLTLHEAEDAIALSLVSTKSISKDVLEAEKLQTIRKSGLMELCPAVPLDQLGGLNKLKGYVHVRIPGFTDDSLPTPKAILLVGLPGGGKSLSAKCIASVLDWPLIRLDIGALKGGIVGQTEANTRAATSLIDALGSSVVWVDEIDKALGGVQSSNQTDGGTGSAQFGHLLTWMEESTVPKLIVATCNNIQDLINISQGALLRRFDDIFFIDLPTKSERREILSIMNARYNQSFDLDLADTMEHFTGAEIEKWVKTAVYEGPDGAFAAARPIYHQARAQIDQCRQWSDLNARRANADADEVTKKSTRKLSI